MSVYTTEVRFICEFEAGLLENAGYSDIDNVIDNSWTKIFKNFPIFDESYREPLCKKILNHYYTREICAETAALWKFWLNQKMVEIMPYYNKLYISEQLKYDPLHEIDFTREVTENIDEGKSGNSNVVGESRNALTKSDSTESKATGSTTSKSNGTQSHNGNNTVNSSTNGQELHSDTPQGTIQNLADGSYLSDAIMSTNTTDSTTTSEDNTTATNENTQATENSANATHSGTENNEGSTQSTNEFSENNNTIKKYLEHISGKNSTTSYSKLLEEYRESLLNIDMDIIFELRDLFMNIY